MQLIDVTTRYNNLRAPLDQDRVDGGAWHHSVTRTPDATWAELQELEVLDAIHAYHLEPHWYNWRGELVSLGGFAYHLAVFPSRRVYLCTPLAMRGAHVASHNGHLVGVVLIGNFSTVPPVPSQLAAAREAGQWVETGLSLSLEWKGHRNWADPGYSTACPGATRDQWVPDLSRREDDDMPLERALNTASDKVYALIGPFKVHLSPLANEAMEARGAQRVRLGDDDAQHNARLEALPDFPSLGGGSNT